MHTIKSAKSLLFLYISAIFDVSFFYSFYVHLFVLFIYSFAYFTTIIAPSTFAVVLTFLAEVSHEGQLATPWVDQQLLIICMYIEHTL